MRTTVFSLLILTGSMAMFPYASLAQDSRPVVRLIYFVPKDRTPQPDIDEKMDSQIKDVQRFYADQMAAHGFGGKTFRFETDARGKAIVHRVNGKFEDAYYREETAHKAREEIGERFDLSQTIHFISIDIGDELIDGRSCGIGGLEGTVLGGYSLIPASGGCFAEDVAAHELGHAFGLQHDFRNDAYLMSYGSERDQLSYCAAEWLDAHLAFNPGGTSLNQDTAFEILAPNRPPDPNAISLRFEIADPDGIHQVQLLTPTVDMTHTIALGSPELLDYRQLDGSESSTVEFVATGLTSANASVSLQVIDRNGNIALSQAYSISILEMPSEVVSIPDPNLAAAVRAEIGGSITTHTMLNLRRLSVKERGIADLTGLEHAHNLEYLFAVGNPISDITPLAGLTQLTELSIRGTGVSDISLLAGMTQLERLSLGTRVSDISALAGLTQLTRLYLSGSPISDISPLAGLTQLERLDLRGTDVSDISPLAGLTQLKRLWLLDTVISDLTSLADLIQLEHLYLSRSAVTDLTPLAGLTQLEILSFYYTEVSDLTPLAGLTQLKGLWLSETLVTDLTPLAGLTQLEKLNFSYTGVSDLTPLAGLTRLKELWSFETLVSDLTPLAGLTQLEILQLPYSRVSDISALSGLTQLTWLGLGDTGISDVSALAGMTQLENLSLINNYISDISALSGLTQLKKLSLSGNAISDAAPLAGLTLLKDLGLDLNPLNYASLHTHIPAMQAKGVEVDFDARVSRSLIPVAGAAQSGLPNTTLAHPYVVEVRDHRNRVFSEVPVTFAITAGDGKLSVTTTKTDADGRAQTRLTLGKTAGTITVQVSVPEIAEPIRFTAEVVRGGTRIDIWDAALRARIAETLGKPADGTITVADMLQLTELTANNVNISQLTALQHAANLTTLSLDNNDIRDVAPLAGLTQLQTVSLDDNNIADVASLAGLTQLQTLSLKGNRIADVTPLTGLTQLKTLDARGNLLSYPSIYTAIPTIQAGGASVRFDRRTPTTLLKLSGTQGVGDLHSYLLIVVEVQDEQGFGFSGVPVTFDTTDAGASLSVSNVVTDDFGRAQTQFRLGKIPGKKTLRVSSAEPMPPVSFSINAADPNTVVNVPDANLRGKIAELFKKPRDAQLTLRDLDGFLRLEASGANIQDLTGLEHAHTLEELWLSSAPVSDLSPLAGLTQLRELWLNNTPVSDVSPLAGLTQLRELWLNNTGVSDVSALAGLTQLRKLWLHYTEVSDISALAGLTQLRELWLNNTGVSDVSALAGLTQLRKLWLHYTEVSDISALAGLTQLRELFLYDTGVSDISALAGLTQLESLLLTNAAVSDVSPLVGLTQLTQLVLHGNPLNYASLYTHIPAMQAKGLKVAFDSRAPSALAAVAGAEQSGLPNTTLPLPFVVEVRDRRNRVYSEVPVTFAITAGDGKLSVTTTTTDADGKAQTRLTLGATAGTTTVQASVPEISQPIRFTATVVDLGIRIAIPDTALRARIAETLGKPNHETITLADMLQLTELTANNANIRELTGLQHADNLTTLSLDDNAITDVATLAGLTQLYTLSLDDNAITDVASLAGLTQLQTLSLNGNRIADVAPLTGLTQLKTLDVRGNLLSYPALYTEIPTIQAGGATVRFDRRTPTTLLKISDTQGPVDTQLPIVVEVQDEGGIGFSGVPVTFSVTSGGGSLSVSDVLTDEMGRAETLFTLGASPGEQTLQVVAAEPMSPVNFSITATDPNAVVNVPDANLRGKIAEILGKPRDAQLTVADMAGFTRLNASNANIRDLTGLEHAHRLKDLFLGGNPISDVSPLAGLTQMEVLILSDNTVSDISPLAGLPQLSRLVLINTPVSDISALSRLTRLKTLAIENVPISDISPLAGLTQLTRLDLVNTQASDISPLAGLTQLTRLDLVNTQASDISPLAGLTQLTNLTLRSNAISDISPLAELTQLTSLTLSNNAISDVAPLAELTQLTYLTLRSNAISEISALAGLTQLASLTLSNNAVSDVSPLAGLTQLTELHLYNNAISDISALAGLTQLTYLTLYNNAVSDVSPLTAITQPADLYLSDNPLNYASIYTHISAMQAKGLNVYFDERAYPALDIISGAGQQASGGESLANPLVVAAIDGNGAPMPGVSVTFTVTQGNGNLSAATAMTDANGRAETTFTLGPDPGRHNVRASGTAVNPVTFIAVATAPAARLAADVNGDGAVNIRDLVMVASRLGQAGQNSADVNDDGVVNIQDLVFVAGELGADAAAPAAWHRTAAGAPSREEVTRWLTQAHRLRLTDTRSRRGVLLLERLLAALAPKETALLANYPNPFNPETWIPYRLAEDAVVTLTIYDLNGQAVRTLDVGRRSAAVYERQSDAIYWNGKNDLGERVRSGVYFYHLSAGDYSATRKMVILK